MSEPTAPEPPRRRGVIARSAWIVVGALCVAVGSIGIVVPGLPTTVFFIGAAAAFSRSSPRLEAWVLSLPAIGPAVRDYRAGLGMPRSAKVAALAMITGFAGVSVVLIDRVWIQIVVAAAAIIGIIVVWRVPIKTGSADESASR